MKKKRILIIDDNDIIQDTMKMLLNQEGYIAEASFTGEEGIVKFIEGDFHLVFLDMRLPGRDGSEILKELKEIRPEVPVVIITGYSDTDREEVIKLGAFEYIMKPPRIDTIRDVMRRALAE